MTQNPLHQYPRPPFEPQSQGFPGRTGDMSPKPDHGEESYKGSGRLQGKAALITGGDSGIGRAVAIAFAREGADVAIGYLDEEHDARDTATWIEKAGRKALLLPGDIADPATCRAHVAKTVEAFGKLDVLVNNGAYQHPFDSLEACSDEQWQKHFAVNVHSQFYLTKAAVAVMKPGSVMLTTASVNTKHPMPQLFAYSATKGALGNMVMSWAQLLAEKGIRVNGVMPGPIWTPFIPAGMNQDLRQDVRLAGALRPPRAARGGRAALCDARLGREQLYLRRVDHRGGRHADLLIAPRAPSCRWTVIHHFVHACALAKKKQRGAMASGSEHGDAVAEPMSTGRLEAFTDGVVAIIITIMVLELKVPAGHDWAALAEAAPVFLAYVLSYVNVGLYWNNHHHLLHAARSVNGRILWANLALLFWLSLVPFVIRWVDEAGITSAPVAAYGVVLTMAAISYFWLQWSIVAENGADSRLRTAIGRDRKGKLSLALYIAATGVAFALPWLAVVLYVVISAMWFIPDRRISRHAG